MLPGSWEEIAIWDNYQQNRISQKVNALVSQERKSNAEFQSKLDLLEFHSK